MENSHNLSPFTLLPSDPPTRQKLIDLFDKNLIYSVIFGAIVSFVGFVLNLIGMALPSTKDSFSNRDSVILILIDLARTFVYVLIVLIAYRFPRIKKYIICSTPVIFTVTVTEVYRALDRFDSIYIR